MTAHSPKWHFEQIGDEGQSFVWLHGWGQDSASMLRLAELFKAEGQHRIYDQPGFGRTGRLQDGAGTEDYADALALELAQVGPGPHILIGHSFGGRVSVQMAARHPTLVKAIILIGGAGLQRRRSLAFRLRAFVLKTLGRLARLSDKLFSTSFRDAYVERFGSADYKNAGPLRLTFVKVVNENLVQEAKAVRCPVLLIYGADDTEAPPEIGKKYEQLMPIARFTEVKGFNHWDILTRGAYQCQALIKSFLKDLRDD
ncbi:alpha/beta fold hydrolase [Kordiimonas lacus]|uniref:Pimeloyl-ACP methyl ester carboxylesterase n=1 Tax=Kordiimonas lacus TaxID=637679 RepID=A0A1G6TS07_9PROT|nr:alpha/beta hydrolase [Kordiimonas lacus]SDD31850.1 Pimeloyl-ACP methyl ester carboxylesterase [Kordiimonas lacus]